MDHTLVKIRADYSAGDAGAADALEVDLGKSFTVAVTADLAGMRLDQALARLVPEHSRSRLQAWVRDGLVHLAGSPQTDVRCKVWEGDAIALRPPLATVTGEALPQDIALLVVHEDEELLVIDKPAGLVVHPGNGNLDGTLLNALLHRNPELAGIPRAGIVHRLDKETSGLMVVAKTLAAQTDLVRQLQARSVRRHYQALVHGDPGRSGEIIAPIGRHPRVRTRMAVVAGGREAQTAFMRLKGYVEGVSLLECRLRTGRTHQIRVHLAHRGFPLVGDPVYGQRCPSFPVLDEFPRQALHAWQLALVHPQTGLSLAWESALPEDFAHLLAQLQVRQEAR